MSARSGGPVVSLATAQVGAWIQTERAAHERWSQLAVTNPRACAIMHVIVSKMGRHNAIVSSQVNLSRISGCSLATLKRALKVLRDNNWIEIKQIGPTGTACAYIVNDRVAWSGPRDGIRYSLFSAAILLSDDEQPDKDEIGDLPPLETVPTMLPDEMQLPSGPGAKAPSQPILHGFERDIPARTDHDPNTGEIIEPKRGRTNKKSAVIRDEVPELALDEAGRAVNWLLYEAKKDEVAYWHDIAKRKGAAHDAGMNTWAAYISSSLSAAGLIDS